MSLLLLKLLVLRSLRCGLLLPLLLLLPLYVLLLVLAVLKEPGLMGSRWTLARLLLLVRLRSLRECPLDEYPLLLLVRLRSLWERPLLLLDPFLSFDEYP